MKRVVVPVVLAFMVIGIVEAQSGAGASLEGDMFLCNSDNVTAGGFRKEFESG